jgi:polysaccharide export outer membrane protein
MRIISAICLSLLLSSTIFCQTDNTRIGADLKSSFVNQSGYYDLSDPAAINIKVSVWGFVRYPGQYVIPDYCDAKMLLSYAGGPTDAANLDDLRIYRINADSTEELIKFNFNDLVWEKNLTVKNRIVPQIKPGDVIVVPGEPRLYFTEYFTMTLSALSLLCSLAILILNIVQK